MTVRPTNQGWPHFSDVISENALPMVGASAREDGQTIISSVDAELAKLFEDRNILLTGGVISYNAAGNLLTFTDALSLELNSKVAGGSPISIQIAAAAASYSFTNDGVMLYAVVDRSVGTASITSDATTLPAVTSANQEVFLIAKRRDLGSIKKIYFRNGFTIANGQTSSMGSQDDFTDTSFSVVDATDNTKQVKFDVNGSTGTSTTLATTQTSNVTVTLPNRTDTLVTLAGSETLSNKRLDNPEVRKQTDTSGNTSELRFFKDTGGFYTAIKASVGLGANYTLTLPNTAPSGGAGINYVLRNPNGSGDLDWQRVSDSNTGSAIVARDSAGFIAVGGQTITTNSTSTALKITQSGSGDALVVEDEAGDTTPFVIDATGNVGVGVAAPTEKLDLVGNLKLTGGLAYSNVATVAISSNSFALNAGAVVHDITSGTGPLNTITGGTEGKVILVRNSTGTELTVVNNSGSGGLYTGVNDDIVIQDKATLTLRYDSTASRWNVIGGTGSGSGGTIDKVTQVGHNFAVGDVLYINTSTGLYEKATADLPTTSEVVGVVSKINNVDVFELTLSGEVKNLTASNYVENALPTVGEAVFLAPLSSVAETDGLTNNAGISGLSSLTSAAAQEFITQGTNIVSISTVSISLFAGGTATLIAEIWSTNSATNNPATLLYTSTNSYAINSLPAYTSDTVNYAPVTFNFANVAVSPGTRYMFVLRYTSYTSGTVRIHGRSGTYSVYRTFTPNYPTGWGVGSNAYRSSLTLNVLASGKLTITEPSVLGQVSLPVGVASGSGTLYVAPKRGVIVGGVNARTELTLTNNGSKNIYTAPAGLEAAELQGWIYIDAATDYRFYVAAQFSKNGAGTDWNLAYQTAGDTPPAGFNMSISPAGVISVILPNLASYANSKINYSINGPAVGVSFPLTIDSSQVTFTNIQAATTGGLLFKENDGTTTGTVSDAGAWTLGPSTGANHTVNGKLAIGTNASGNAGAITITAGVTSGSAPIMEFNYADAASNLKRSRLFADNSGNLNISMLTDAGAESAAAALISRAGAWTLGPSDGSATHTIKGKVWHGKSANVWLDSTLVQTLVAGGVNNILTTSDAGLLCAFDGNSGSTALFLIAGTSITKIADPKNNWNTTDATSINRLYISGSNYNLKNAGVSSNTYKLFFMSFEGTL